jgi:uncharacterized membrane protein YhfC
MLNLAFLVELIFVIGFPLALGAWIQRRWRLTWLLFAAGAVTFGLSQAVHLPLNQVIFSLLGTPDSLPAWANALLLGLTAGLCEEGARYAAYRWVLKDLDRVHAALLFGVGHGGIESIVFVGLLVGVVFLNMSALQSFDFQGWALPGGQLAQLQTQMDAYWGQIWYTPLLGAVERLFSVAFHMAMAVLVLIAVRVQRLGYWLLAVGLHTGINAAAMATAEAGWNPAATEGVIGLFALLTLLITRLIWRVARKAVWGDQNHGNSIVDNTRLESLSLSSPRRQTANERLRETIERSKWE